MLGYERPQDQNFDRQTWSKTQPHVLPCLLPAGKYMVSRRWSLLSARDRVLSKTWAQTFGLIAAIMMKKVPVAGESQIPGSWRCRVPPISHGRPDGQAVVRFSRQCAPWIFASDLVGFMFFLTYLHSSNAKHLVWLGLRFSAPICLAGLITAVAIWKP